MRTPGQTAAERYAFRLFVTGHGARSVAAESNLRMLCHSRLTSGYEIEVVDTVRRPKLAGQQRVSATPMLIRLSPPPQLRILGDLSDLDSAATYLGLPPTTSTVAETAAAASADGILAVDRHGKISYCNAVAAELFGRPVTDLVGQPFGYPVVAGQSTDITLIQPDDRPLTVDIRVSATTVDDNPLHIVTLRDITRQRQADRELRAALDHQNTVVGVAAHELSNPLFAIKLMVEALSMQEDNLTEGTRAIVADIGDRTAALQTLVRRLLTAARIDTQPTRAAPQRLAVLETLLDRLAKLGDNSGHVNLFCPPELSVLAEHGEFTEMLDNYLDNAFTHGQPPLEVHATGQDGWVELRFSDHGPGVPNAFVPHLFQRFSRHPVGKHDREGTGLGLWIVASLAEKNGGSAWYEPNPGGGSCFCIRLPQHPPL